MSLDFMDLDFRFIKALPVKKVNYFQNFEKYLSFII